MSVELRHVRCFLSVARHLHFARAAEELGIAPPALTRQIQEAERLLGVRLFHRTKRSVELTAAGVAYLDEAATALDHLARGAERAALAERGEVGKIVIGYVGSAVYSGVLQTTVRGFRACFPQVEIGIEEIVMRDAGALLGDGRIDIAYVRPPVPQPEGVEARTVHRDAFIVALPADSPLTASSVIAPAQLRDQAFVVPEQESGTLEVARRGRFPARIVARPGTLAAVLALVSLGGDVAVVPRSLAQCVTVPGVEYREIAGKAVPSEVAMMYRRFERAAAVRAYLDFAARA
ncbi:LysR family transcriptional regulator [Caballeronia concitans]|uniref:LysR family transcriptional regulator n=1 Tax=Caballeronia concitans TaxID=1777133 RepID=A0A658R3H6_9BURK|nr:LysR family transcriptional regulator [Caballeronia concitans]KIG01733.1 transcriptional regulator, LysR family [Burkholderia sp. MR1]SAL46949.1 LysR family transcriptional regulator [Caballeronia concitans]